MRHWRGIPDKQAPLSVPDLGTGTGCLLLALLSELPNASGIGRRHRGSKLVTATANARRLGLGQRAQFTVGDWGAGLTKRFDLVISNPPYIPDREIETLAPEVVRFDPVAACWRLRWAGCLSRDHSTASQPVEIKWKDHL